MEPRMEPVAVDMTELKTLSWVIEQAAGKKIVYVGEYHGRFSNHDVELQVIKDLFKKNPRVAIGMEMFQRPFQQVLDEYISGVIHEREFLKRTEYFSRWGYDFNFYKPILDFARREKIPVIALNARTEIIHKVAEGGLTSLSVEEKEEIPGQMDLSDNTYRGRLKRVFEKHKHFEEKKFDFFYEAQVLWDETMALSVDEYLRNNPLRQMIVVAGSGHLAYGSGIPNRAFRRSGHEYVTILSDADMDRGIADYLIFPKAREGVTAPVLMAVLKEQDNKVVIADFSADSPSGKAGLRVGDTILDVGGSPVRTIDDIKIELLYKHHGESIKVKVMRKRLLLWNSEWEFTVSLT